MSKGRSHKYREHILSVLEEKGPQPVAGIRKFLPDDLRGVDHCTLGHVCLRMKNEGLLKRWGGGKGRQRKLLHYGLLTHTEPESLIAHPMSYFNPFTGTYN